jgi:hypothetical protein
MTLALGVAFAQGQTRVVVVDLELEVRPEQPEASLLWIGVSPAGIEGNWLAAGATPTVLEASDPMPVAETWSVALPVVDGLRYFAVVDTNGSGQPDGGDAIGGPIEVGGEARPSVAIDRWLKPDDGSYAAKSAEPIARPEVRWTSDGSGLTPPQTGEGELQILSLSMATSLVFFERGRLLVAGFEPGAEWADGVLPDDPTFVWTSKLTPLSWPLSLPAPMPDGLDVVVGLDLDGDGALSAGDLVARPVEAYAGQTDFTLDRTLPRVRPPPAPPHHDLVEQ